MVKPTLSGSPQFDKRFEHIWRSIFHFLSKEGSFTDGVVCWQDGHRKVYWAPNTNKTENSTLNTPTPPNNNTNPQNCSVPFQTALKAVWKHLCQKGLWGWHEKQVLDTPGKGQQPSASKEEDITRLGILCCGGGETIGYDQYEVHSIFTWVTNATVYENCYVRTFEAFHQPNS